MENHCTLQEYMWLVADIAAKDHVGGLPLVRSAFPKA